MTAPASLGQRFRRLSGDAGFREILRGSAWALGGQVLGTALGLLTSIVVARFYGAEVMGVVAVVTSLLGLATILALLGLDTAILRLLPEHLVRFSPSSAARVYRQAATLATAAALAAALLLFLAAGPLAARLFAKPQLAFPLALAAAFLLCNVLATLNTQAVRGLRLVRLFAFLLLLPALANLLCLLLLTALRPHPDNPLHSLFASMAIGAVGGWLIVAREFRRRRGPADQVQALPGRALLGVSLPMLATSALFFLTTQAGTLILGIFHPEAAVGLYAVAVKLSALVGFVLTAVNAMAAPRFAELFHAGRLDELFAVAQKSAKLIFWVTTPLLLALALLGKPLLGLAFGPEFTGAYPALLLLISGQFVNAVTGSTGFFLNMTGHEQILRNFTLLTALLSLGLNLALIPRFAIAGAAFAAMFGLAFLNLALLLYIRRKYGRTTGYLPFLSR